MDVVTFIFSWFFCQSWSTYLHWLFSKVQNRYYNWYCTFERDNSTRVVFCTPIFGLLQWLDSMFTFPSASCSASALSTLQLCVILFHQSFLELINFLKYNYDWKQGGIKAVVWTDVIQIVLMYGSFMAVLVKGVMDVGGFETVWQRNDNSSRLEFLK